jgi:hypothetical protein
MMKATGEPEDELPKLKGILAWVRCVVVVVVVAVGGAGAGTGSRSRITTWLW